MIISFDWSLCASPGEVSPAALRDQLRTDPTLAAIGIVGVTATGDRLAGEEIEIELPQAPTGAQTAAIVAVLTAHDAASGDAVGAAPLLISPTPNSAKWTDIPGGLITIDEDETISGDCSLMLWAGDAREPAGVRLSFSASRVAGGSARVATWGVPGGRVSGFKARIQPVDDASLQVQFQRRGSSECRVHIDLDTIREPFGN